MSRFTPCPTCGRPIAHKVRCPYCAGERDRSAPAPSLWRRQEEKVAYSGCPGRRPPSAWERFADGFGPTFREQQRARRLASARAQHLAPPDAPALCGAVRVRGRRGWRRWHGGVGWIDGDHLWWKHWLLPKRLSLPRREIASVEMRPARGFEILQVGAGFCIWTLAGPLWTADLALKPPDEGILRDWLLAGHLRLTPRG